MKVLGGLGGGLVSSVNEDSLAGGLFFALASGNFP